MQTKTNVFLDFDNTQFDGHLHNTMMRYTNKYQDNDIPGLTKEQLMKELMGKAPITPSSKWAVQTALMNARNDAKEANEKAKAEGKPEKPEHKFDFFDGRGLNELVKKRQDQGVDVVVLTASMFPGAINAINQIKGLTHLNNIPMIVVPIDRNKVVMAKSKDAEIQKYEENQRLRNKDLHTIHNIFVDDSKENIEVFTKSKNPNNTGILATKGIDLEKLNNAIEKALKQQAAKSEQRNQENASSVEEGLYANASAIRANKNSLLKFTETQNTSEVAPKLPPKPSPKLPPRAAKVESNVAPAKPPRLR